MDDKRMVKSITDWKPLGKKAKGKTRKRWMDGWTDGRTDGWTDRWMDDVLYDGENHENDKLDEECKKQRSLT